MGGSVEYRRLIAADLERIGEIDRTEERSGVARRGQGEHSVAHQRAEYEGPLPELHELEHDDVHLQKTL